MNTEPSQNPTVVILHGIGRSSRMMLKMEQALSSDGYAVVNLDYPSTKMSIEALAEWIYEKIKPLYSLNQPIHFVGHSMGGMLVRMIIHEHRPDNLGRVVMIGSPNQGSVVADFLQSYRFYQKWFGPAGQQIGTNHDGIHHRLPAVDYPCAVIAGDRSTDPLFSLFLHKGPNDGKVMVEHTKVRGMQAHVVVHVSHAGLPRSKEVIALVKGFLREGVFVVSDSGSRDQVAG